MAKENMTLKTFPPSKRNVSNLKDAKLFALNTKDQTQINELNAKREALFDPEEDKKRYTVVSPRATVYYDPDKFSNKAAAEKTLKSMNAAEDAEHAKTWRNNTKHRIVHSKVECNYPARDKSFEITLSTACAPNFMGTSQADENEFLTGEKGNKHFKKNHEKKYKDLMTLLFRRLLFAQAGQDIVLMPFFGGGIYLKELSPEAQTLARKLIHEALREALEKESKNIKSGQEIIYCLPDTYEGDEAKRSEAYQGAENAFQGYVGDPANPLAGSPHVSLTNANIFDVAHYLHQQNRANLFAHMPLSIGMINPGSDRTVGGEYQSKKGSTLEEQIFNFTDAAIVQCKDLNDEDFHFREFPPELKSDRIPSMSSDPDILKRNFSKEDLKAIAQCAKENNLTVEKSTSTECILVFKQEGEEDQRYTATPTKISGDENTTNWDLMVKLALKANLNQPNLILRHSDPAELKKMQEACKNKNIPYKIAQDENDFNRLVEAEIENKNRPASKI